MGKVTQKRDFVQNPLACQCPVCKNTFDISEIEKYLKDKWVKEITQKLFGEEEKDVGKNKKDI